MRRTFRFASAPIAVVVGLLLSLVVLAGVGGSHPIKNSNQPPPDDAACDADGVDVSYAVNFQTPTYGVGTATVSGIASTCAGAVLTVTLGGTGRTATATVGSGQSTIAVPFASAPAAKDVTSVHVELAGGTTPVPSACATMKFDHVWFGTVGDDVQNLGNQSSLGYGLTGNDTLSGGNGPDCVDGGPGNDTITGGNQNDVLIGGTGDDVLDGGNGTDRCIGGGGDDTFRNCEARS